MREDWCLLQTNQKNIREERFRERSAFATQRQLRQPVRQDHNIILNSVQGCSTAEDIQIILNVNPTPSSHIIKINALKLLTKREDKINGITHTKGNLNFKLPV